MTEHTSEHTSWIQYLGRPWLNVSLETKSRHNGVIRVIDPGSMITADFRMDRLNVLLNDDEVVTRFCFG